MMGPKRYTRDTEGTKKKISESISSSKNAEMKGKETSATKMNSSNIGTYSRPVPENSTASKQVRPNPGKAFVKSTPRQTNLPVRNVGNFGRGSNNQSCNTPLLKRQIASASAVRNTSSNNTTSNRNNSAKDMNTDVINKPNNKTKSVKSKVLTRSSVIPVHSVAFVKDESKMFKQKTQSQKNKSLDDNMIPEKDLDNLITSISQTRSPRKVGRSVNENSEITQLTSRVTNSLPSSFVTNVENDLDVKLNFINTINTEFDYVNTETHRSNQNIDFDSEVPEKDVGSTNYRISAKVEVTTQIVHSNMESKCNINIPNCDEELQDVCKCESNNYSDEKSEDNVKEKGQLNLNLSKGDGNNCFRSLDDLNLENLEAYISACKGQKASSYSDGQISHTPSFDSEALKPKIFSYTPNEVEAYGNRDELNNEKSLFYYSFDKREGKPLEQKVQRMETEIIQRGSNVVVKEADETDVTDREKCDSETLIKIQSSEFDILKINVQMDKKENTEANNFTGDDLSDKCIEDGTQNDSEIMSDCDRKTFIWTPAEIACFGKSVKEVSHVSLPIYANDIKTGCTLNSSHKRSDTFKEGLDNQFYPGSNTLKINNKYSSVYHSVENIKRINEKTIKAYNTIYNIDCAMGDRIAKEPLLSSNVDIVSTSDEAEALNCHFESESQGTQDVFEGIDTLEVLNLKNVYSLENEGENMPAGIVCGFFHDSLELCDEPNESNISLVSFRSSGDEYASESEDVLEEIPLLATNCVWVDYKRPIIRALKQDYSEENINNDWLIEEDIEVEGSEEESNDMDSILLLESDPCEWIVAEKNLEELRSCLEECSDEAEIAAREIKNMHFKNSRKSGDKIYYDKLNKRNKYGIKAKRNKTLKSNDLMNVSELVSNLKEAHATRDYDTGIAHNKLDSSAAITEDDRDYFSVSSSDDELLNVREQDNIAPMKSYLSFGKSCVNVRKKKDKRLSFFNLFKL